jgi:hypothetical protein
VNKAASVSVYTGVGTFWGSGEKEWDCWDNRRAPNTEADLIDFYTTTVQSKNIINGYSEVDPEGSTCEHTFEKTQQANFAEFTFRDCMNSSWRSPNGGFSVARNTKIEPS